MRIIQALAIGLFGILLPAQFAIADAEGERSTLSRIVHEIQTLEPLIIEAASQANPDARVRFQYDWLRQDLTRIRLGIQEHIDTLAPNPGPFRHYVVTIGVDERS